MTFHDDTPQWLAWAREIQALSQTGLAHATGHYDLQRYTRLLELAAEITVSHTSLSLPDLAENFRFQPGYATPKVDVRGAVIREGKILLVKEKADGCWCMPGGWADVGDLPSAMVVREVREESGFDVVPRKVIGVFDANRTGRPLEFFHAFKIVFLCGLLGGTATASDETTAVEFFSFEALPPLSTNRTNERHLAEIRHHLADPLRPAFFD